VIGDTVHRADLDEIRAFYATLVAEAARCSDPRIERAFAMVPREAFLPPGPWEMMARFDRHVRTPSADPAYLYRTNMVIALDSAKGINNGEPVLHASWMQAVAPAPGERICHIGAGTGYYTAILSILVVPGGTVTAFEIEPALAAMAQAALEPYEGVTLVKADATAADLPESDVIYVNAGVAAPPLSWLKALAPGGRLIFPWRPSDEVALAVTVRRCARGFAVKPLMPAFFIPCVRRDDQGRTDKAPDAQAARSARSLWLTGHRPPDETAVAVFHDVWFSSERLAG
jgi:protein-L-isoaspartate(D-aspartate) O-methyltransferase